MPAVTQSLSGSKEESPGIPGGAVSGVSAGLGAAGRKPPCP